MSKTDSPSESYSKQCGVVACSYFPQRPSATQVLWHSSNVGHDQDGACCSRRLVALRGPDGCLQCGPVPGGCTKSRVRTEASVKLRAMGECVMTET